MRNTLMIIALMAAGSADAQLDLSDQSMQKDSILMKMDAKVRAGAYEEITSILIAKDGKLVYEKYYQGNDQDSKHNVRSGTKTMATLLTGIAIDQGFIGSEQDKIMDYLQHKLPVDNPDPRKNDVSIEDLLTMSSPFECDDNNSASRGYEERMYIIEDWTKFLLDLPIRSYPFSPKPEDCPYGRSMSYCSAGAATVAEVVENAVKMPLDSFAIKNLFEPLGIEDHTIHKTPMKIMNTAGGSEYRSRDLLKLIQMMLNNGQWNGKRILSKDWVEKATSPKCEAWPGMEYGYFLWLKSFGPEEKKVSSFAMAGNGGNKIVALPELGVSVVLTTTNYNNRKAHGYTDELLDKYIVPALQ